MRVAGASLGILIAASVALVVWRLAGTQTGQTGARRAAGADRRMDLTRLDQDRLPPPLNAEERRRLEYASRRVPYLEELDRACRYLGCTCGTADDLDTLEVMLPSSETAILERVRDRAIELGAWKYGYRRIRFLEQQAGKSGSPPSLVAETTRTPDGRWVTFVR